MSLTRGRVFTGICMVVGILFALSANAGLIRAENVDIYKDGSDAGYTLLEDDYSLVWMDFGLYNGHSLDQMNTLLGDELVGWRYANYDESLHMMQTIYADYMINSTTYQLKSSLDDQTSVIFSNELAGIIGINTERAINTSRFSYNLAGVTDGTTALNMLRLSGLSECANCTTGGGMYDGRFFRDGIDGYSWLIVKDMVSVDETSSFFLFVLSLLVLGKLRRKA